MGVLAPALGALGGLVLAASASAQVAGATFEPEGPAPMSAHRRFLEAHRNMPVHPGHIDGPVIEPGAYSARGMRPCKSVFGFLPHWIDPVNIQWDLLTHVACFAIELTSDGNIGEPWGWPWRSTIATARGHGVEVLATITLYFYDELNQALLTNPTARARLIENLRPMMTPHADGICVDLEGNYTQRWSYLMPSFVAQLRRELRVDNPNFKVYVATPNMDWFGGWNFMDVANACDGLFIMGYDYYGPWSGTSGPCSPLRSVSTNLLNTLETQYPRVVRERPDKIILGLPYYGNHWITVDDQPYSRSLRWIDSVSYEGGVLAMQQHGRRFHELTRTPWTAWRENGEWHQVWSDDSESLAMKFDAAMSYNLAGVGMWALGYDYTRPEMWAVIRDRFVDRCRSCAADVDDGTGSGTPDGGVTIDDLFYYINLYVQGFAGADLDDGTGSGTPDGGVTIDDLLYFVGRFEAGC